jgi:hypothetical protein
MVRKPPPSVTDIVGYWSQHLYEGDIGVDWCDAHERCWRCGCKRKLHKCHITPNSIKTSNAVEDFILLCKQCHEEAPDVNDRDYVLQWLKDNRSILYDNFWVSRSFDEALKGLDQKIITLVLRDRAERFKINYKKYLDDAEVHFGLNGYTHATRVWLLKKAIQETLNDQ